MYLVIVELSVLTEPLTPRWNRNREARFSNSNIHSEPGSVTSPGAVSGSNPVTPPSQLNSQGIIVGAYSDYQHQQCQPSRHPSQPPTPSSGPPSGPWSSGRRLVGASIPNNAPPPVAPVSVPRFGFPPNIPVKEKDSQEQRDKDNRNVENKAAGTLVVAPRIDTTGSDQLVPKQERKLEDPSSIKQDAGRHFSPTPTISAPPPITASTPRSGASSTSKMFSPPLVPHLTSNQSQQQPQQHAPHQQQPSQYQQGPPSGPRGAVPPTGPRANISNIPPLRSQGTIDKERERTDIRVREAGVGNKWATPSSREKEELPQASSSYASPGTGMIHPDRLKGIAIVERTESVKDRDPQVTHSHPSSVILPTRQEQKLQEHNRTPSGLVSSSVTADEDVSHDRLQVNNNNLVVDACDSSIPWNVPTFSRSQPLPTVSPVMPLKSLAPTSVRPTPSSDRQQHSLSSILNPEGGGGYTFGSTPSTPFIFTANNSNNNSVNANTVVTAVAAVSPSNTTHILGSTSNVTLPVNTRRTSPQAPAPTNIPNTPTIVGTSLNSSPRGPSTSLSPQMPVKQVPTGPRADRANHSHLGHGHGHGHGSHVRSRGSYWGTGRGRGTVSGMVIKREVDDESVSGIGSSFRASRGGGGGGGGGDWSVGGRGRGGFDSTRVVPGRRDARFASVDRMESVPGSVGGVAGAVSSAVGRGTISGSLIRRNSFGDIETVEPRMDREFEGGQKSREENKEQERIDAAVRRDRLQSSGYGTADNQEEVKLERVEIQLHRSEPSFRSASAPVDRDQPIHPDRYENFKPEPPSEVLETSLVENREFLPPPQGCRNITAVDRMDVDDTDDVHLTQEDVVTKMEEIDRELAKCKDRLAELKGKKQICHANLESLHQEEAIEREREREREKERGDKERLEVVKQERVRKEREERERLRKENDRREREKLRAKEAEVSERLLLEQRERERERERLEKETLERELAEQKRKEKEELFAEREKRVEQERLEQERLENERLESERINKEKREQETLEMEKIEEERRESVRVKEESESMGLDRPQAIGVEMEQMSNEQDAKDLEPEVEVEVEVEVEEQIEAQVVEEEAVDIEDQGVTLIKLDDQPPAEINSPAMHLEPEQIRRERERGIQEQMETEETEEFDVRMKAPEEVTVKEYSIAPIAHCDDGQVEEDREADADGEFEDEDGYGFDDGDVSFRSNQSTGSPGSFVMDDYMVPPPLADGEVPPFKIPTRAELELCISALPYFRQGPPREPKDYAIFQKNNDSHLKLKPYLLTIMQENAKLAFQREKDLKDEYIQKYEPYLKTLRKLENEEQGKKKPGVIGDNVEPEASIGEVHSVPMVETPPAPTSTGRRGGRNTATTDVVNSEREFEAVIQILADQDAQAQYDKKKEKGSTEALIPDMILERKQLFQDYTNILKDSGERKVAFGTLPPTVDWSETEKQVFTDRYLQTPKQWQKIADHLPGRTYKDCIRHYYLTKKIVGYKEKLRIPKKGKRRNAKARSNAWANGQPPPRTRQSKLINADAARKAAGTPLPLEVKVQGEDDEGVDSEDVTMPITETGRPRRAAAPVFGGDSTILKQPDLNRDDSESTTSGLGNSKRTSGVSGGLNIAIPRISNSGSTVVNADEDSAEKGPKRVRASGAKRESGKRTKPAIALVEREKPVKEEKKKEELEAKESDVVNVLAGLSTAKGLEERAVNAIPMQAPIPILPQQAPPQMIAPYPCSIPPHSNLQKIQSSTQAQQPVVMNMMPQQQQDVLTSPPSRVQKGILPGNASQGGQAQRAQHPQIALSLRDSQEPGSSTVTPKKEKQTTTPNSYWSVPETLEFPVLLAKYGTNWNSIANCLVTKTPTMVSWPWNIKVLNY